MEDGFALVVVPGRQFAQRGTGVRRLSSADAGIVHMAARATHHLLYGLLPTVVALGVVNAFVRGCSLFGLVRLPWVGDRAWRRPITERHGLAASILLGLAFFQAAAALVHHCAWRNGVPRRMLPSG